MGAYPKFEGVPVIAFNKMKEELKRRAMQAGLAESDIVIRPLRPEDLELSNPHWTFALSSTVGYVAMINTVSIDDLRFVGINGLCYTNTNPTVNQLKIERAGSTARIWNIQEAQYNENDSIWFDDPVLINQNETLTIYQYCSGATTQAAELIVFFGAVAEKRGLIVNP